MSFKIDILILLLCTFIYSPLPIQHPLYEVSIEKPKLEETGKKYSIIRNLQGATTTPTTTLERKQYVVNTKVTVTILNKGVLEDHTLNLTTMNLQGTQNYKTYSFYESLPEGKSLVLQSYSCYKKSKNGTKVEGCTFSTQKNGNTFNFRATYNYSLYKEEYSIINYKFLVTTAKSEVLLRYEQISVSGQYSGAFCDYKFNLPKNFTNLGLEDGNFIQESDKIYSYKGPCPSKQLKDRVRLSPNEVYWKANYSIYLETKERHSNNIIFLFKRMYRGGKNINKFYKITTNENEELNESDLIKDEIFLEVSVPGKNNSLVGVNIQTAFSNKLNDEFLVNTSKSFYDLPDTSNVDDIIKNKVKEILNDTNSKYKDKPDYYKLGKFVYSHMSYDLKLRGKNLTLMEIYNGKKGVCEHYTLLYNTMLNLIGIKTLTTFGWAMNGNTTSADSSTISHAWTVALIDGKFKELDATWNLFEGISAGHIFRGFNENTYTYTYTYIGTPITQKRFYTLDNIENINKDEYEELNATSPSIESTTVTRTTPTTSVLPSTTITTIVPPKTTPTTIPTTTPRTTPTTTIPVTIPKTTPTTIPTTTPRTTPTTTPATTIPKTTPTTIPTTTPRTTLTTTPTTTIPVTIPKTTPTTTPTTTITTVLPTTILSTSLESTTISSSLESTIPSTTESITHDPYNSTSLIPRKLLIGYDGYTFSSGEINFFAYIRYFLLEQDPVTYITIRITRNLRALDEVTERATCNYKSGKNDMAKYECNLKGVSNNVSKVKVSEVSGDIIQTNLAIIMGNNLHDQTEQKKLSDQGMIVLDECQIDNNNHIITCSIDSFTDTSLNGKTATLHIPQNNIIKDVEAKLNGNGPVQIQLDQKSSTNANMNNTIGTIKNGQNIYLVFKKDTNSTLDYPSKETYTTSKKSSGGMSTGAIIAIIIPTIIVLVAGVALALFLGKRKAPSIPNNSNNAINLSSV